MDTPKEQLDMRVRAYNICRIELTGFEVQGLYMMVLGEHDCRTLDIWPKIESLFIMREDEYPIMHQDALVGMGDFAKQRNKLKEKKT